MALAFPRHAPAACLRGPLHLVRLLLLRLLRLLDRLGLGHLLGDLSSVGLLDSCHVIQGRPG